MFELVMADDTHSVDDDSGSQMSNSTDSMMYPICMTVRCARDIARYISLPVSSGELSSSSCQPCPPS